MIRLHYRIADAIDQCLEKLKVGEVSSPRPSVKPSRRASFEVTQKISAAMTDVHAAAVARRSSMPAIITAALNERLAESDSTSVSEDEISAER